MDFRLPGKTSCFVLGAEPSTVMCETRAVSFYSIYIYSLFYVNRQRNYFQSELTKKSRCYCSRISARWTNWFQPYNLCQSLVSLRKPLCTQEICLEAMSLIVVVIESNLASSPSTSTIKAETLVDITSICFDIRHYIWFWYIVRGSILDEPRRQICHARNYRRSVERLSWRNRWGYRHLWRRVLHQHWCWLFMCRHF